MMYSFHVNLYARPSKLVQEVFVELRAQRLSALRGLDGQPPTFDAFFALTFEQALAGLAKLPRMDIEPDGFFVFTGGAGGSHWQVDGHLFDFGDRLHRVELHGHCPVEAFEGLLSCLGWPSIPLVFELVREGVSLDEGQFRRWAAA